jgi:FlaA1/EpsC-like NDP-sugar epimerase
MLDPVLVIGGTGTLGRVIVDRFLELGYSVLIMSRDEQKHYWMRQEYKGNKNIDFKIGDIRNYANVCTAIKGMNIVVNCAAMKQVPISEYSPMEAVLTNVIGTANIVRAIEEHNYPVKTVIAISTDKACNPYSVMGMTKALAERIITAANKSIPKTRFFCLRCGNFGSSNGSVVELFRKQIEKGGPVTVTSPDMVRYFVDVEEVSKMLFAALMDAKPGEIYLSNVKEVKILELAKQIVSGQDIKIEFTGIRPGEKLREELISAQEKSRCLIRKGYTVIQPEI